MGNKNKKPAKADCINVFWKIAPNWESLSYEQKCEFYWKYEWVGGKRVLGWTDSPKSKTSSGTK